MQWSPLNPWLFSNLPMRFMFMNERTCVSLKFAGYVESSRIFSGFNVSICPVLPSVTLKRISSLENGCSSARQMDSNASRKQPDQLPLPDQ